MMLSRSGFRLLLHQGKSYVERTSNVSLKFDVNRFIYVQLSLTRAELTDKADVCVVVMLGDAASSNKKLIHYEATSKSKSEHFTIHRSKLFFLCCDQLY